MSDPRSGLNPAQRFLWLLGRLPGVPALAGALHKGRPPQSRRGSGPGDPTDGHEPRRPNRPGGPFAAARKPE